MTAQKQSVDDLRKRLIELLDYIREQARPVDVRSFDLSRHKGFLRRGIEISNLPGVRLNVYAEEDHWWLAVSRLRAEPPPKPDAECERWIQAREDPAGPEPEIDEEALAREAAAHELPPEQARERESSLRMELERALEQYREKWRSWAERERPRRLAIALYRELFALRLQIESEETARPMELVWGTGIAVWDLRMAVREGRSERCILEYPLLTQAMEIGLDERTLEIYLRPRDEAKTRYEGTFFAECNVAGAVAVERQIQQFLDGLEGGLVNPFDPGSYSPPLKAAAAQLDSRGAYVETGAGAHEWPVPGQHLQVSTDWVLLARPKAAHFLIQDLERLKRSLEDGCAIPDGPAAFVRNPGDDPEVHKPVRLRGLSSRDPGAGSELQELYFPLPYNEEQLTIVRRLETSEGVTVQGPPGTGKTYTIANIICHYLATGRRVLVTSKGEPALKVLQEKIPEEVRPLTVALLGGDAEGLRQFEGAIRTIQARLSQIHPERMEGEISALREKIEAAHARLAAIERRMEEIAHRHLSEVAVDGRRMRASEWADFLLDGAALHRWFDDAVTLAPEHEPPLTAEEGERLRQIRRKLGEDLVYAGAWLPMPDRLPGVDPIADLHEKLLRLQDIDRRISKGELPALRQRDPEVMQAAQELLGGVNQALEAFEELRLTGLPWVAPFLEALRKPEHAAEREALAALLEEAKQLRQERSAFLQRPVEAPPEALDLPGVREAIERAAETGRPFGWITLVRRVVRETLQQIRVSGLRPSKAEDWRHVARYLELGDRLVAFATRWNHVAPALGAPALEGSLEALRQIDAVTRAAEKAHQLALDQQQRLLRLAAQVFQETPKLLRAFSEAALGTLKEQLSAHLARVELVEAETRCRQLGFELGRMGGPLGEQFRQWHGRRLGKEGVGVREIVQEYAGLLGELQRITALKPELDFLAEAAARLERAGAPRLAARVRTVPASAGGEDPAFPSLWREAWSWARMRDHLEKIDARQEFVKLSEERSETEKELAGFYQKLVAEAAWLSCKKQATQKVMQALQGYATAVRKIGKGTGPNAVLYRRDARKHMNDAGQAIPCWIMSHARVSESMPAEIGSFDLVIVDEASQSDIWAMPVILRGKKLLIVGDDKQVSPEAGFLASEQLVKLRERYLRDQPFGEEMTPEKSLYDLAARVFASRQVMLREHFRCAPPIIAYSNRMFYKGEIRPLRIPRSSERIDPPLVDVHLEGGRRDYQDRNIAEAHYIAEEIESLLADSRFKGRTLGAVSLLGMEQAKLIDELVRQRCDDGELLRRKFLSGDARTFQGSERDILFLSLVVDPGNCKALSGLMFEQRFNVAASRARDRMYLVRSVEAAHLSEKDLRLTLLRHCENPLPEEKGAGDLIKRCESQFEREVFQELAGRGYRVIPQVKTGGYRIDLVVEGANDRRLAIECDGDAYHGPEQWQRDMARQRVLERAGWTFWRCFASTWKLRREAVLEDLLGTLASLRIEPCGAAQSLPAQVERRHVRIEDLRHLGRAGAAVIPMRR